VAEITSCQNKIDDLKKQQQQKINLINQLKTDIKNHEEALDKVKEIIKSEGNLRIKFQIFPTKPMRRQLITAVWLVAVM